jgi:hypothetical protein
LAALVVLGPPTKLLGLGATLLVLMVTVSVRDLGATLERLRHAGTLAREAGIEIVRVTRAVSTKGWLGRRMRDWYELAPGQTRSSSVPLSEGGACFLSASSAGHDKVLCLCSSDRSRALLLSLSGYPLAHAPDLREYE